MQCGCYLRGVSLFGRRWRRHYALVARAGPPSGESIWFALRFLVPILDHLSADLALPLIGRVPRSVPSSISLALVLPITVFKDQPGVSFWRWIPSSSRYAKPVIFCNVAIRPVRCACRLGDYVVSHLPWASSRALA